MAHPESPLAMTSRAQKFASLLRLWPLTRGLRVRLLVATICLFLASAASFAYPRAVGLLVDGMGKAGVARQAIKGVLVMLLVAAAIQGFAGGVRRAFYQVVGDRVVARLREKLYGAMLGQEVAFFDQTRTGQLVSRLYEDTETIQNALTLNLSIGLRSIVYAAVGITLMLSVSPLLTLTMLSCLPPVALTTRLLFHFLRKQSRAVQDAIGHSNEAATETIAGIRTVRAFDAEALEMARYRRTLDEVVQIASRRALFGGLMTGVAVVGAGTAMVVIVRFATILIDRGSLTVGAMASCLVYALMTVQGLSMLAEVWADVTRASGAMARVCEIVDRKPQMPTSGGERPEKIEGRLEFRDVSFAYPSRPQLKAIDRIAFAVAPGEVVALVGPSGAGKSTIVSLLARLYEVDAGEIRIDGYDLRKLDPRWLRQQIGIVSQEPLLFTGTIADNIRYSRPEASEDELIAAARAANAHEFISALPLGYATAVGERGLQLSGGQKQRVAIARAVLKDPRILILDEATSALDAESEALVTDAIGRLMKGRTTIVIAHRLSTVLTAKRLLVFESGRIVQSGSHADLVGEDGLYQRLVKRQAHGAGLAT